MDMLDIEILRNDWLCPIYTELIELRSRSRGAGGAKIIWGPGAGSENKL